MLSARPWLRGASQSHCLSASWVGGGDVADHGESHGAWLSLQTWARLLVGTLGHWGASLSPTSPREGERVLLPGRPGCCVTSVWCLAPMPLRPHLWQGDDGPQGGGRGRLRGWNARTLVQ